jgi:hypothetical protein
MWHEAASAQTWVAAWLLSAVGAEPGERACDGALSRASVPVTVRFGGAEQLLWPVLARTRLGAH